MPKNLSPGCAGGSACRTACGEGRGTTASSLTCTCDCGQHRRFCALLSLHPM